MRVGIVGARTRSELADEPLVNAIIDDIKTRYSKLLVITKSCDRGVGKIIKNRCKDPQKKRRNEFDFAEASLRIELVNEELPKTEFATLFNALNATLVEVCDEFHLLTEEEPKGTMADLLQRVIASGKPYAMYKPSEVQNGVKQPVILKSHKSTS